MPSILAQTKAYHGEKVISSFEASRKRLLGPQEQEETAKDDRDRAAHPEKRARISAGETTIISHKSLFAVVALDLCKCSMARRNFALVQPAEQLLPLTHPINARSASSGEALPLRGTPSPSELGPRALEKVQHLKKKNKMNGVWPCFCILSTLSQRFMTMKMRQLETQLQP